MAKKIIGIDLGTTNSVVAFMEGGIAKVIPNKEGSNTTPSMVAFTKDNKRLVGILAKRQAVTNPTNTVFSAKRFIGRKYNDMVEEFKNLPYEAIKKSNGDIALKIGDKEMSPEEISAAILSQLKQTAEDYLGQKVDEAVITVPAYFNDAQRQATKNAGKIAGLEVKRIINEPTAAALAYGVDKKKNGTIAVFDFGGGTFDISILEVDIVDDENLTTVKSTNGDTHLGGDDIDKRIIDFLVQEFKKEQGIDLSKDNMALQQLKVAAEKAKIELSTLHETEVILPCITFDSSGPKHLNVKLSRAKLESLCSDIFDRLAGPCKKAIKDAKITKDNIDEVVLVGGSTRIPKVQELVKDLFGKAPSKSVNPDEVVAAGAAIQGGVFTGDVQGVVLLDVTPLSLGIETEHGIVARLIERNTTIPTNKSQVFSTAANNQTAVDIRICQGEREFAKDNKILGQFRLDGIPPAPRGIPQIEVTFDIDANGIVNVSAKDKATGKEQRITITDSSGLSEAEINRMVDEAKAHESEDKKSKDLVQSRSELDSAIFQVEKSLNEHKEKLEKDDISKVQEAIEKAKSDLKEHESNTEELKKSREVLLQASAKIGEIMYKQAQEAQAKQKSTENSGTDKQNPENANENGPIDVEAQQ